MFNFLKKIMSIIYGNDGMPADEFIPERIVNDGNVLARVQGGGANILGSIETVEESADIFRGKYFKYINTEFIGLIVRAERMIKEGTNYFVFFDDGQKYAVQDIDKLMVENHDYMETDLSKIVPNKINAGLNPNIRIEQKHVEFDPVIEILKRRKKKPVELSLSIELDLPSKELYAVLVDDYDNAEDKIIDYLFTPENIVTLKECIKNSLKIYYGNKE